MDSRLAHSFCSALCLLCRAEQSSLLLARTFCVSISTSLLFRETIGVQYLPGIFQPMQGEISKLLSFLEQNSILVGVTAVVAIGSLYFLAGSTTTGIHMQ